MIFGGILGSQGPCYHQQRDTTRGEIGGEPVVTAEKASGGRPNQRPQIERDAHKHKVELSACWWQVVRNLWGKGLRKHVRRDRQRDQQRESNTKRDQ